MRTARVRLGHSLGDRWIGIDIDALRHAVDIVTGKIRLEPRPAFDPATVARAEGVLDARPRPVYSYAGDLHPDLGSVGLILSHDWAERSIQGASKCDSGGLAGGKGCFVHIPDSERDAELQSISSPGAFTASDWSAHLDQEITTSYGGIIEYVNGHEPDSSTWNDARSKCIDAARSGGERLDRRLWTWELRMQEPPEIQDIHALVVSPDAHGELQRMFTLMGIELPEHLRIITPDDTREEPGSWFYASAVRTALAGG